jgi:hypothetical protein
VVKVRFHLLNQEDKEAERNFRDELGTFGPDAGAGHHGHQKSQSQAVAIHFLSTKTHYSGQLSTDNVVSS